MVSEEEREIAKRVFIHQHLDNHMKAYLTIDHKLYTETVTAELFDQYLYRIPETGPYELSLPEDPFDKLSRILNLKAQSIPEEKWATSQAAMKYLSEKLSPLVNPKVKPKSERVWYEESEIPDYDAELWRPMSPILSRRAIRETPVPRSGKGLAEFKRIHPGFQSLSKARVPVLEIQEPKVSVEDALNLHLSFTAKARQESMTLLKSIHVRADPNAHLKWFKTEEPAIEHPKEIFMPMFSRRTERGHASSRGLDYPKTLGLSDLASILPKLEVEDDIDGELHMQSMSAVDGWQVIMSSPATTATASPTSSQEEDELDPFYRASSPDTEPPFMVDLRTDPKMDEVMIPRRDMPGQGRKPEALGYGRSLSSFLKPHVKPLPVADVTLKASFKTDCASPEPTSLSLSILGQASSALHAGYEGAKKHPDHATDDLNDEIERIYASASTVQETILDEELDAPVESISFMEVIKLPPPTDRSPDEVPFMPSCLADLRAPVKKQGSVASVRPHGFLKKLKVQALNIELSWVPFKAEVPSIESVLGIEMPDFMPPYDSDPKKQDQVDALLDHVLGDCTTQLRLMSIWEDTPAESSSCSQVTSAAGWGGSAGDILMSRAERRRLSQPCSGTRIGAGQKMSIAVEEQEEFDSTSDKENTRSVPFYPHNRPPKRPRLESNRGAPEYEDSPTIVATHSYEEGSSRRHKSSPLQLLDPAELDDTLSPDHFDPEEFSGFSPALSPVTAQTDDPDVSYMRDGWQDDPIEEFSPLEFDGCTSSYFSQRGPEYYTGEEHPFSQSRSPSTAPDHEDRAPEEHADASRSSMLGLTFPQTSTQTATTNPYNALTDLQLTETNSTNAQETTTDPHILNSKINKIPSQASSTPYLGLDINSFAAIRTKCFPFPPKAPSPPPAAHSEEPPPNREPSPEPRHIPEDIYDKVTLRFPESWYPSPPQHLYLASMDFIQKRSIVRSLRSEQCLVDLAERPNLFGADLILDPHSCILFMYLSTLPSECEAFSAKIAELSWRYSTILVLFEAYPPAYSYRAQRHAEEGSLFAYADPVLKAIKKLRRRIGIDEGLDAKRASTLVHYAFANSAEEAGLFVRLFGEMMEADDVTGGMLWGDRSWLDEYQEEEQELSSIDGMNPFASRVILCQYALQDLLDMEPGVRLREFGGLIGVDRVMLFNDVIQRRFNELEDIGSGDVSMNTEDYEAFMSD